MNHAVQSTLADNSTESQWPQTGTQDSVSPHVRGPTSPTFTLDVVKRRFKERGFDSDFAPRLAKGDDTRLASSHIKSGASLKLSPLRLSPALRSVLKDPLWDIPCPVPWLGWDWNCWRWFRVCFVSGRILCRLILVDGPLLGGWGSGGLWWAFWS